MNSPRNHVAVEAAASLLATPGSSTRAALVASVIVDLIPDSACAIHQYIAADGDGVWTGIGMAGDISLQTASFQPGNRLIAPLLSEPPQPVIYSGAETRREDYAHLGVTRTVASLAYVPLLNGDHSPGPLRFSLFPPSSSRNSFRKSPPSFNWPLLRFWRPSKPSRATRPCSTPSTACRSSTILKNRSIRPSSSMP